MKMYRICIMVFTLLAIPFFCFAQGGKEAFVGTWKLISIESASTEGSDRQQRGQTATFNNVSGPKGRN